MANRYKPKGELYVNSSYAKLKAEIVRLKEQLGCSDSYNDTLKRQNFKFQEQINECRASAFEYAAEIAWDCNGYPSHEQCCAKTVTRLRAMAAEARCHSNKAEE